MCHNFSPLIKIYKILSQNYIFSKFFLFRAYGIEHMGAV